MYDIATESAYPTPYANSSFLPLLLMTLSMQKNAPNTSTSFEDEYDYIVVGAGSAGATVAARLSELECVSVLLLEAGKSPPLLTEIPAMGRSFWFTDIDWAYKTVPQKHTGSAMVDRRVIWPSGKALGGSSIINAMNYVRGNRKNYNDWAAQGAKGWSFRDVFPYFLKLENNRDPSYLENGYHATSGPVSFESSGYKPEFKSSLEKAATEMGYRILDSNGPVQTGFYDLQGNVKNAQRCSTAKAYLVPAENRKNLDILTHAHVRKISIEDGRASGVVFDYKNSTRTVRARKEVIVSAGTTNSAQIIMLSGVGPKQHLKKFNIPVLSDLPVGDNLQDHCATVLNYELDTKYPTAAQKLSDEDNIQTYISNRTGPLSSFELTSYLAFLRGTTARPNVDDPEYQLYFAEAPPDIAKYELGLKPEVYKQIYGPYEDKPFFVCLAQILQPVSRGTVRLQSDDPYDPPLIDPNYLAHPKDVQHVVNAMKVCDKIGNSRPMRSVGSRTFSTLFPGCEKFKKNKSKYFACHAKSAVTTLNHQVGTCKMGDPRDPSAVVDPELRVKRIKGLRVVDASVMPIIPSGNTNIPTIMVAEKAADLIKQTIEC